MRLERIGEDQVRCVLTREDLGQRGIRMEDLAYGNAAAEELFGELVEEAVEQFHMDFSDAPCMIEAIPSGETLILLLTRVEDPEELNLRYARFTDREEKEEETVPARRLDDVISMVKELAERAGREEKNEAPKKENRKEPDVPLTMVFSFADTDRAAQAARAVEGIAAGPSTLYRAPEGLFLSVDKGRVPAEEFNRLCNILTEYGEAGPGTPIRAAWLEEHARVLIAGKALTVLARL